MTAPRYRQLADSLRGDIASGRYPVGSALPTEEQLCRAHGVSRHTAREALRVLGEAGLVKRRRRAGTTVAAKPSPPAFVQPLGDLDALLQYARDARLTISRTEQRALSEAEARAMGAEPEPPWLVIQGVRRAGSEPLALSTIHVLGAFASIAPELKRWEGAVQELLAREFGLQVERIEQEIGAEALSPAHARRLAVVKGSAALRTRRRYYDREGRLVLASDTLHPASRFTYAMTYRRGG